jgi:hypothetical protein
MGYENNKPPQEWKYPKGVCGNPLGGRLHRRYLDKQRNCRELVAEEIAQVDLEKVRVIENGRAKQMRKLELTFRRTLDRAMKGDVAAGKMMLKYAEMYFDTEVSKQRAVIVIGRREAMV